MSNDEVLLLSHVIQRAGEDLHDVKPVHRDLRIGELFLYTTEEGRGYVADHFEYLLWPALVVFQEGFELLQGFLAPRDKQHGLAESLHVDADGDAVAPLAGGLVQANGFQVRQIEVGRCLTHVVLDDSP